MLRRTDLIMFPLAIQTITVAPMMSIWGKWGTDPDVTWRNGRGCRLVVHYWADLQLVHWICCYDNISPNARCQRVLVLAVCLVLLLSKRDIYYGPVSICLFVYVRRSLVLCRTTEPTDKQSNWCSHTKAVRSIPMRSPWRHTKYTPGTKNWRFSTNLVTSRKRYKIGGIVTVGR